MDEFKRRLLKALNAEMQLGLELCKIRAELNREKNAEVCEKADREGRLLSVGERVAHTANGAEGFVVSFCGQQATVKLDSGVMYTSSRFRKIKDPADDGREVDLILLFKSFPEGWRLRPL